MLSGRQRSRSSATRPAPADRLAGRSRRWLGRGLILLTMGVAAVAVRPMTAQRGLGTPTGREPRLIWTPQRQATWARMRADFESSPSTPRTLGGKYYKLIKDNAECKCRYADTGLWATLMFQFTGDRKYSDLAWGALEAGFLQRSRSQLGGNYAREYAAEYVLQYRLALSRIDRRAAGGFHQQAQRSLRRSADQYVQPVRAGAHGGFGSDSRSLLRPGVSLRCDRRSEQQGARLLQSPVRGRTLGHRPRSLDAPQRHPRLRRNGGGRRMDRELRVQHRNRPPVAARRRRRENGDARGALSRDRQLAARRGAPRHLHGNAGSRAGLSMGRYRTSR